MTGQINIPGRGSGQGIGNATIPPEGPKCLPLSLDFTAMTGSQNYSLDVGQMYQKGPGFPGFSVIQGVFIDNSLSASPLTMTITGTQQTIKAPAGSQGYYPILSPTLGQITFNSIGNCICLVELYNVPLPAGVWDAVSQTNGGGSYDNAGNLKTKDQGLASMYGANLFLPTQDTTLLAAKSVNGDVTAINVNIVEGGGGGGAAQSVTQLWRSAINAAGNNFLFENAGSGDANLVITSIIVDMVPDTFIPNGGVVEYILTIFGTYYQDFKFYVPPAAPLTPGRINLRTLDLSAAPINIAATGYIYGNLSEALSGTGLWTEGYGYTVPG